MKPPFLDSESLLMTGGFISRLESKERECLCDSSLLQPIIGGTDSNRLSILLFGSYSLVIMKGIPPALGRTHGWSNNCELKEKIS